MTSSRIPARRLRPLGLLAPGPNGEAWRGDLLKDYIGALNESLRTPVADYLDAAPPFIAWMEYTRDVVGDRFGVSGGSAIMSDGYFYWRGDAGAYVREYGISVPEAALDHMRSVNWAPPVFATEEYDDINRRLEEQLGLA